jgi:hypothetical protein
MAGCVGQGSCPAQTSVAAACCTCAAHRHLCRADCAARRRSICRAAAAAVSASLLCALPNITTFRLPPSARRSSLCAAARAAALTRPALPCACCPAAAAGTLALPAGSQRIVRHFRPPHHWRALYAPSKTPSRSPDAGSASPSRPRASRCAPFALLGGWLTAHPACGFAYAGEPPHADSHH